jgi:hypothetical protein
MEDQKGSDLEKAISRLDATAVVGFAQPCGSRTAEDLADALWKSESLLDKHASKKNWPTRRRTFIGSVAGALASLNADAAASLTTLPDVLDTADANFAKILEQTGKTTGATLPPLTQVSAATAFASQMLEMLEQGAQQDLGGGPELRVKSNFSIGGRIINPDTELFGVLKAMGSTVLLLAYQHGWLNAAGEVVLPDALTRPSTADIEAVQSVLSFAAAWHGWERAQVRARFAHRPFKYLSPPFPAGVLAGFTSILDVEPNHEVELIDFIANDRLLARTNQQYFQMLGQVRRDPEPSLDQATPLAPVGFVSFEEKHGLYTLYEYYSYDVQNDTKRYAGLTLMEWLRGYAILRRLAIELAPAPLDHPCPQLAEAAIVAYLTRGGLSEAAARSFLGHCCLTSRRSDIYDHPFIRVGVDRYLFVAPSQRNGILGPIIVSALNGVGAMVQRKGTAFEKRLRKEIQGPDRKIAHFTKKRDKEEYDYDALMVWGNFCFLFECKNHTLSGGVIQLAYHAQQESLSHARQVLRLVDGLLTHPDMLDDHLPEARGKLLVPCVVNNLQYSVPDGIDGVLFADSSMIKRFLELAVIGQVGTRPGQEPVRMPDGEIIRLWAGDAPTPLEFLRHLRCPVQFMLTREHTECRRILTGISEHEAVAGGEYTTSDVEIASGRAAAKTYDSLVPLWSEADWARRLTRVP